MPSFVRRLRPADLGRGRLRWRSWLAVLGVVLLVHAVLLGRLPRAAGAGRTPAVVRPLQVRQLVAAAPAPVVAPRSDAVVPATQPPSPRKADPPPRAAPAAPTSAPRSPARAAELEPHPVQAAPAPVPADADADAVEVPVYATRLPPATVLHYDVRRGGLAGSAELAWHPAGTRYELRLQAGAAGAPWLGWRSEGGFDAAGIAPERFVDRRRNRDVGAANFRRDSGRITYSGPRVEHVLLPGTQDRVSWMLQLPAIVDAEPARFVAGARVVLGVTGARGDADVWTFEVVGVEDVEVPSGPVERALHLRREPRRRYDSRVDVWLDPARAHLPLRVRLAVPDAGDSTDFMLREQADP